MLSNQQIARECVFEFIHASGPGGQNVNKVATAVQLKFCVDTSASLSPEQKIRLKKLAGWRMARGGWLTIEAKRYRSQEKNKADAIGRLYALVRQAQIIPLVRRATRPSRASAEDRLALKRQRSAIKKFRSKADSSLD